MPHRQEYWVPWTSWRRAGTARCPWRRGWRSTWPCCRSAPSTPPRAATCRRTKLCSSACPRSCRTDRTCRTRSSCGEETTLTHHIIIGMNVSTAGRGPPPKSATTIFRNLQNVIGPSGVVPALYYWLGRWNKALGVLRSRVRIRSRANYFFY